MKYCYHFLKIFILLLGIIPSLTYGQDWTIGILAKRGAMHTHATWQPWIDALNKQFEPQNHFSLVTLDLNDLAKGQAKGVDFILTNQSQFFYLNNKEVRWLATLKSTAQYQLSAAAAIGSAIFVRKESPFYHLKDLQNKTVSAVGKNAFGGFLLGYNEFYKQGLAEDKNLKIKFTGFPVDNTLLLLKEKKVDAAIVPVCIFENLVNEKVIKKDNYRLLTPKTNNSNCVSSTELLPNWSLAAMPQVPSTLAAKLISYLLNQKDKNLPQWTPPYSTTQADTLLRQLYRHPKQDLWHATQHLLAKYKIWIICIISLLTLNYLWVTIQIHRKTKALQQAYEEMRQYEQQLVQADRLTILGEMSAGIAHEINQPLAAMRMYIEGLKYSLTSDSKATTTIQILDKVLQQIDRSTNIIHQLMHWAKGKKEKEHKEINLKKLIQQVYNFVSLQNKSKYQFQLVCPEELQLKLKPTVLEQVICNCLLNAIQANANQIQIIVKQNTENIFIYILDNGTGFKASELRFPFVPFRSSKSSGLGLGLVLCQRLMRSIDGDITLANREDHQGAEVILNLPKRNKQGGK